MTSEPVGDPLTLAMGAAFADQSTQLMVGLLEQSQDCVKMMDSDGALVFMNRNGRCIMEFDDFRTVAGTPWWDLWPEESQPMVRTAVGDAIEGRDSRFVAMCPTGKGTPKWWDVTVSPVRNDAGSVFQIVSFSRDITEQIKAKDALETMALEMRHRLRNAFAVSGAIAMVSGREAPEHADFATELANRYSALAIAQSQLLEQGNDRQSLRELLVLLCAPYPAIVIDCADEITIDSQRSRVVALAIGELATNSVKYGALAGNGAVRLVVTAPGGQCGVAWTEASTHAGGSSDRAGGDGHALIKRMAEIHGGQFTIDWQPGHLGALLTLPAE